MVSLNVFPKRGKRLEKSAEERAIIIKAKKGKRNKNRHKSAHRPIAFIPFVQTKALKRKKKPKKKTVGLKI